MLHNLGEPLQAPMAWPEEQPMTQDTQPGVHVTKKFQSLSKAVIASTKLLTIGDEKGQRTRVPPTWRSFKEVSVSGIDATLDHRSPLLRRILWSIVLVVCTSLMCAQCFDRVLRYIDEPININVRVTHNDTLIFPALTICNKKQFNLTAALQFGIENNVLRAGSRPEQVNITALMGVGNKTIAELWDLFAYKKDAYIPECWFKRSTKCDEVGEWTVIHSAIGPCLTFKLNDSTINVVGSFSSLYIRLQDLTPSLPKAELGSRIVLHDPREHPTLLVRTHSMLLELGWGRDIKIELRKFQMLDTSKTPCTNDDSYLRAQCGLECFQNGLTQYSRCRMPFMLKDSELDECRTAEEYSIGMKSVYQMLFLGDWTMADCDCEYECNSMQFQLYPNNHQFDANNSRIRVFFTDLIYEDITEESAYTTIALLCDIGGTLGLLMGASVLTVCELLEVLWSRCLQGCCRLEERQPPSKPRIKPSMQEALSKLRPPPSKLDPDDLDFSRSKPTLFTTSALNMLDASPEFNKNIFNSSSKPQKLLNHPFVME